MMVNRIENAARRVLVLGWSWFAFYLRREVSEDVCCERDDAHPKHCTGNKGVGEEESDFFHTDGQRLRGERRHGLILFDAGETIPVIICVPGILFVFTKTT